MEGVIVQVVCRARFKPKNTSEKNYLFRGISFEESKLPLSDSQKLIPKVSKDLNLDLNLTLLLQTNTAVLCNCVYLLLSYYLAAKDQTV